MKLKNKIILFLAIAIGLSGCYPVTTQASSDNTIQNAMLISENGTYSGSAPEGEAYYRLDIKQAEVVTMTFEAYQNRYATISLYDNGYNRIDEWYADYDGNRNAAYGKLNLYLCQGSHYIKLDVDKTATYSFKLSKQDVKETFTESQWDRNDILSQAKKISLDQKVYGMIENGDKQDFYIFDMPFSGNLVVAHTNYIEDSYAEYEILNSEGDRVNSFYADYDNNKGYAYDKDFVTLDKGRYYIKVCGNKNGPYHFVMSVKPEAGGIESVTRMKTKATVRLEKSDEATGYILQYSTSDKFGKKSTKSKIIKGTTVKLKGLKKNKKYYLRVKRYKKCNGKTYYSDYGNVYTVWP